MVEALRACVLAVHGGTSAPGARMSAQQQLDAFEMRPTAWRECIGYIRAARDPVVIAFLLGAIERAQTGTTSMAPGDRSALRAFVLEFAVAAHRANFARFLLTKCAKILVDAAKIDWPTCYPDFFDQVLGLCQDTVLRPFGLQVLLTTIEEWLATSVRRGRDVPLSSARRATLRKGIAQNMPRVMPALVAMLREGRNKRIVLDILHLLFASTVPLQDHLADGTLMSLLFQIITQPDRQDPSNGECRAHVVHCLAQMVGRNCIPRDAEGFVMHVSTQVLALLKVLAESGGIQSVPEEFLLQLVRFLAVFLERHLGSVESQPNFPMNDLLALLFRFSFVLPTPALFVEALSVWGVFVDFVVSGKSDARRRAAYTTGLMQLSGKLLERMLFSYSGEFLAGLSDAPMGGGSGGGTQLAARLGGHGSGGSGGGGMEGGDEDMAQQMWNTSPQISTELDDYLTKSFELIASLVSLPALVERLLSRVLPVLMTRAQLFHQQMQSQVATSATDNAASRDLCTLCGIVAAAAGHFVVPATFAAKAEHASNVFQTTLDHIALPIVQLRSWGRGHFTIELLRQCYRTLESFASWLGLCLRRGSPANLVSLACSLLDRTAVLVAQSLDASVSPAPEIVMVSAVQLARSVLTIAKPSSDRAGRLYQELLQGSRRGSLPQPVRERIAACMADVVLTGIAVSSSSSSASAEAICAQFTQAVGPNVQEIVNAVQISSNLQQTQQQQSAQKPIVSNSGMQNKVRGAAGNLAAVAWSRRNAPRSQKQIVFQTIRPALEATGQLLHLCLVPVPQRAQQEKPRTTIGGMRTAKQLMTFLRFVTDSLRSEIGVDTLCQIVVALCVVVKQYILGGLATQTVSPSATLLSLLVSVLSLFALAIDDPSLKFRRVLPHVLNAIAEFDQALFSPSSPVRAVCISTVAGKTGLDDVLTVRFRLFRVCMLQHWTFFIGNQKMNKLPDPFGKRFFESSMQEVLNMFDRAARGGVVIQSESDRVASGGGNAGGSIEAVAIAPELIRYNLRTLEELQRVHRLFYKCGGAMTGACLTSCLRLLAGTGMELLQTEIVSLVHKIAACDFKAFFESFLPSFVTRVLGGTNASPERHRQLLSQFGSESVDAMSFHENCLNFVNGFA